MNFTTLQTDVADAVSIDTGESSELVKIKRWINKAYHHIQGREKWAWLESVGEVQSITVYGDGSSDGSVTCTQDSRTVTGSGTTFTAAMVGRYFKCTSGTEWYQIAARASNTSITLNKPYVDTTVSGASFYVYPRFYEINTDVREVIDVHSVDQSKRRWWMAPNSRAQTTYTTGTVTGSINTKTVTGTGTSWIAKAKPGDKFEITGDSADYHIATVDSDTQVTLVGNLEAAASGAAYTITRENIKRIELPIDYSSEGEMFEYLYIRKVYDMVNDNDVPDMPEQWHDLIVDFAKTYAYEALDDQRRAEQATIADSRLQQLRSININNGNEPAQWTYGNDWRNK